MTLFRVILCITLDGITSVGSTDDLIEAGSIDEAERVAIEAWQLRCPERTFTPLLTIQQ